jgi:Thiamine pyrophosphate enzyme, N-terminal TPP binding domain
MGTEARLRLSRRWRRRPRCRAGKGQGQDEVRPGPARGDGGLHGPPRMQSSPDRSGSATRHRVRASSICSTACTTPRWTIVALVGQQARSAIGVSYQQEVDLQTLFGDVTEYVAMASVPQQVRHLIDRAVRIADNRRAVTCVILPNDLQELDYKEPPSAHGATHTGIGYAGPAKLPAENPRAAENKGPRRTPPRRSRTRQACRPASLPPRAGRSYALAGKIETQRLLLNSATDRFPDGLANSSGLVGKNLMAQSNQAVWGVMQDEIRSYKGRRSRSPNTGTTRTGARTSSAATPT